MESDNTILHNAESLTRGEEAGSHLLCRVPGPTRLGPSTKAQKSILFASNSEIRFVMGGGSVVSGLRRMPAKGDIRFQGTLEVFQGDYQGSYEMSPQSVATDRAEITIYGQNWSAVQRFADNGYSFRPSVARILLPYDWGCCLGNIKRDIRPPGKQEMPGKRLLVYGSSITHGGNTSIPSGTYVFRLAWRLEYDLINPGCTGSCQMDETMISYVGPRDSWDMVFSELGINVIETWDGDRLYDRALASLATVPKVRPDKQIFVADMYYNRYDFEGDKRATRFRGAIQRCMAILSEQYGGRLHYINELEAMDTPQGLSSDGLYPSDLGRRMIAEGLAGCMAGKGEVN